MTDIQTSLGILRARLAEMQTSICSDEISNVLDPDLVARAKALENEIDAIEGMRKAAEQVLDHPWPVGSNVFTKATNMEERGYVTVPDNPHRKIGEHGVIVGWDTAEDTYLVKHGDSTDYAPYYPAELAKRRDVITLESWKGLDPERHKLLDRHGRFWDVLSIIGGDRNEICAQCPGHRSELLGFYSLNKGDEPQVHEEEMAALLDLNHNNAAIIDFVELSERVDEAKVIELFGPHAEPISLDPDGIAEKIDVLATVSGIENRRALLGYVSWLRRLAKEAA